MTVSSLCRKIGATGFTTAPMRSHATAVTTKWRQFGSCSWTTVPGRTPISSRPLLAASTSVPSWPQVMVPKRSVMTGSPARSAVHLSIRSSSSRFGHAPEALSSSMRSAASVVSKNRFADIGVPFGDQARPSRMRGSTSSAMKRSLCSI